MPKFAAFMVLFALANAGLPGTSGFVGEFLVILASFKANVWYAFLAGTTLVLGAAYTLWLVKRVIFGAVANEQGRRAQGSQRPRIPRARRARAAVLLVGIWPAPLLDMMRGDDAAFGAAIVGLEDRSLRFTHESIQFGRLFNAGLIYARPEIFLASAACVILLLDLVIARRSGAGSASRCGRALVTAALVAVQPLSARVWRSAACSNWTAWRRC
jgi:formate hydrogenlyase subunit 3/multisubunit Na+/H+ antiporter MnhD subunit